MIIGLIFIVCAGVAAWVAITRAQNTEEIMVAGKDLAAYSFIRSGDLKAEAVSKSSITDNNLTKAEFEDMKSEAVISSAFLEGQRIDTRNVLDDESSSFAVVLPDERVVAATSTVTGAAVGTIQAGDVVDINNEDSISRFGKVICIATEPSGCKGVLPAGVTINADDSGDSQGEGSVLVLLAVPAEEATSIAGKAVNLALNPFCRVDNDGFFYSPRESENGQFDCTPPPGRQASRKNIDTKVAAEEVAE